MVSIGPYTQAYDMQQQWDFVDLRGKKSKPQYTENSVMDILTKTPDFSRFLQIVKLGKMENFLDGQYLFSTVLIPSDAHINQKYPPEFFKNMGIGYARKLVLFATMPRLLDRDFIKFNRSSYYPTKLRTNRMYITTVNDVTQLPGCTSVIHWNYKVGNGLIHVVDNLLIPSNEWNPL